MILSSSNLDKLACLKMGLGGRAMVPGCVQGMSRVPPDQPEGGGRGRLYLERLWKTLNLEPRTLNLEQRDKATRGECRRKNAECRSTVQSHIMRHQSHHKAC